jgi:hypothetical protein
LTFLIPRKSRIIIPARSRMRVSDIPKFYPIPEIRFFRVKNPVFLYPKPTRFARKQQKTHLIPTRTVGTIFRRYPKPTRMMGSKSTEHPKPTRITGWNSGMKWVGILHKTRDVTSLHLAIKLT